MTNAPTPGRVALVTGASRRLGQAMAVALARAGWDVAVHHRDTPAEAQAVAAEVRAAGRRAAVLAGDLDRPGGAQALFDAAGAALGPVHAVINNASRFEHDTVADFSVESLEGHLRTNVAAPVLLARALHAQLAPDARGVVVNLLDQKLWNPNPDFFSYTLSKAALECATGLLARALAPRVRVVGVAPGISLPSPGQSEESFRKAFAATPLGRSSTPADVAAAVVYAVDAEAVTGTTLLVDGGQHLVPTARDILFLTS